MALSLFYVVLAILGLSFLIFIHELGHFFMARRVGMKVDTFSIGFGRPIYSWEKDGTKWQIGWLLFGGYVKIAGMETDKDTGAYDAPGSFFSKTPFDRLKVAFMGPFVNLVFALAIFSLLYAFGGRDKNFSEFTHVIGWVDPNSQIYAEGVRPGDEIMAYNGVEYQSSKDHLYAPMTSNGEVLVQGNKINYATGEKTPFNYKVSTYPHPASLERGLATAGILSSGSYVIYDRLPDGQENPLPEGSPLKESGIEYGDRLIWIDGERIFSAAQLNHILNEGKALLTVERSGQQIFRRIPHIQVKELKFSPHFKEEVIDWQFEAGLHNAKFQNLYFIPYDLTNEAVVQEQLRFIDKENEEVFAKQANLLDGALQPGDKILAVDGMPIQYSYQLLKQLQTNIVNLVVQRNPKSLHKIPSLQADAAFEVQVNDQDLQKIVQSIGKSQPVTQAGDLYLLKPIVPKTRSEFSLSPETQTQLANEVQEQKKAIEALEDPEIKAQALRLLNLREKQLLLGLPSVQDRRVEYNPTPTQLFSSVFSEIWRTLSALFTGALNPKWISGPIGIVQVVHDNTMLSIKEGLFWLGAISLNLGVLNLLPIPMLDGGTILISLIEMITRRRIHPKTLEKLVLPFAIILIVFFIFLTYNDLSRLFSGFIR